MILYLDSSSVIKLYISEHGSDHVRQLVHDAGVVATSVVTYAETRAALARLRRDDILTISGFKSVKREFESQWPAFLALDATDAISRRAGNFAERYRLRGFDSIHLASFAEVASRTDPRAARFSSFDDRLNDAAQLLLDILSRRAR